jgi:LysM repeat protein
MRRIFPLLFLACFALSALLTFLPLIHASGQAGTVYDLIAAVNYLRSAQGVSALEIDGSLMSIAQSQSDYQASLGTWTHEGPGGTRPRDRAVAAGYGGGATVFVSENVAIMNPDATFETLIYSLWADSLHWNTMTNANYTHIGAGITVSNERVYYTIDVGYVAGAPGSYVAGAATFTPGVSDDEAFDATQIAMEQVSPVTTSTPNPDGSVVHTVGQGQSLWSIAIAYDTTINDIIALNGLATENPSIWAGNNLVIYPSLEPSSTLPATETPLPATRTPRPSYTPRPAVPTRTPTLQPTPTKEPLIDLPSIRSIDRKSLGIAIIAVCAAGLLAVIITGFRPEK